MKALQLLVYQGMDVEVTRTEGRQMARHLGWRPASLEIVARIIDILVEHVIRQAGSGTLTLQPRGEGIELATHDRGVGFLRIYTSVRETGLVPAIRAGVYEVGLPVHGGLAALRQYADELFIACTPGHTTHVRAVLHNEPRNVPHDPCPCVITHDQGFVGAN